MSDASNRDSDVPPSNRRRESRRLSCIPAYVENQDASKQLALIRDISTTGARLLVRELWREGESVQLSLYISDDPHEARAAQGKVVRAVRNDGPRDVWGFQIAVEFDEPITEHAEEIRTFTEQQAKLGLFK